ncbi:endonuclease domain-containing protein [Deinococcus multiflagellatus]|uniref:Endonuclease domain-containing protein n=2 Tax=Deinococcus multiflagellatus TaxID=1656887 RepID=A0ABW1ZMT0_9DEIO
MSSAEVMQVAILTLMALRFTHAEGTQRARRLRRDATPEERILWAALRNEQLGVKFRRQQPLGFYIADFVCFERALVVEVDGGQHAQLAGQAYDAARTAYLNGRTFRVLRFWNHEVRGNLDGVLMRIQEELGHSVSGS